MKKLDINITKAEIKSFSVDAEDGKPVVSVTLGLMTDGGKVITSYLSDNRTWRDNPLEVSIKAMSLIGELITELEGAAVRQCRDSQLALPAPKSEPIATVDEAGPVDERAYDDIDDKPIDLSEIAF